jgi:hypothetical protein
LHPARLAQTFHGDYVPHDAVHAALTFFPNVTQVQFSHEQPKGKGHVTIVADTVGAEIFVDGRFVGNAPGSFTGPHKIEVKDQNGEVWQRDLEVLREGEIRLTAKLTKR